MALADLLESILDIPTVLITLAVLLCFYLYKSTLLPVDFPPGPKPWPILGNIPQLAKVCILILFVNFK